MINNFAGIKTRDNKFNIILLIIYTFLLLFFCSQMSPLYPINEWDDVNLYFNIGKCLTKGRVLYVDTFDQKGPVIFFIYALGYLISNTSFIGVFLLEIIAWLALILSVYHSARLFIEEEYALISALIFPIFILKYMVCGGSAEEFILVLEAISMYLFLRYLSQQKTAAHKPGWMFLHGMICTLVFFTKFNLIVFWFFPLLAIFILIIANHQYKNLFLNILAFIGGVLIIVFPIIFYLYTNQALEEAYNIYIVLNSKYANIPSINIALETLWKRAYDLIRSDITFFGLSFIGIFIFPLTMIRNILAKSALVLCAVSVYITIFMDLTFHHYYLLPFAIFCAPGLIAICSYLKRYITIQYARPVSILFMIILLMVGIKEKSFFHIGGEVLSRQSKPDNLAYQFGKIIEKENSPTLLNLGFGYGNSVFTVCNITPNTKYFITPNVPYNLYPDLRNEQEKYLENKKVQFVILTNASYNYDYFKDLPALIENYTLVATYISDNIMRYRSFYTYYLYKRND